MKKVLILSLITISVMMLTGCNNKKENRIVSNDDTCPGENCVYAIYTDEKTIGDTLKDYTKDYTTLKNKNDSQSKNFLGHILSKNEKIKKGFVCTLENGEVFCLEGYSENWESFTKEKGKKMYESYENTINSFVDVSKCNKENEDIATSLSCDNLWIEYSDGGEVMIHGWESEYTCSVRTGKYSNEYGKMRCY